MFVFKMVYFYDDILLNSRPQNDEQLEIYLQK